MRHCVRITKDGHKCTRTCKGNSKYCWQHQQTSKKSPKRRNSPKKSELSPEEIQKKFCSCVSKIKLQNASNKSEKQVNPWAICTVATSRISNSCKKYE
jgi:hypothetical protein